MTILDMRLPSCLDFKQNALERLRSTRHIDYFEVKNHNAEIVFYWRSLAPGGNKTLILNFEKKYTGKKCEKRESKAYLYYREKESVVFG